MTEDNLHHTNEKPAIVAGYILNWIVNYGTQNVVKRRFSDAWGVFPCCLSLGHWRLIIHAFHKTLVDLGTNL